MTPEEACSLKQDLTNHYGYIYCLTLPNGKKYVGQSIRPWKTRWRGHKTLSSCSALKNALYKYDLSTISWELVAYATNREDLDSLEIHYIREFDTLTPKGYNLTEGGSRAIPISILVNKPKLTEQEKEEIKRLREENLKIFTYRRDWSDLGFNIISYLTIGNENICITGAQYNSRLHSKEIYNDPIIGKELREKQSIRKQKLSSHPIYCVELKQSFASPTQAVKKYPEWNRTKINACCAGLIKSHLGFHFYRLDDSPDRIAQLKKRWKEAPCSNKNKFTKKGKRILCNKHYTRLRLSDLH